MRNHDVNALAATVQTELPSVLPEWMATQRWYADKDRDPTQVVIEGLDLVPRGNGYVALATVRLAFRTGLASRYFVPLVIVAPRILNEHADVVATLADGTEIVDGSNAPEFGEVLIETLAQRAPWSSHWSVTSGPDAAGLLSRGMGQPARTLGVEQSNTSLRFGDAVIVKLIRRLQPGPNPEAEILAALAQERLPTVPKFLAAVSWLGPDNGRYPVALAQAFVPNEGDGWSWLLRRLANVTSGATHPASSEILEPIRQLGQRTAELHRALSQIDDPSFQPIAATVDEIAALEAKTRGAAGTALQLVMKSAEGGRQGHAHSASVGAAIDRIVPRVEGYRRELGTVRIRVHGDFHLGQVLRAETGDWVIIDFEGEPARSIEERREKQSALKDVSGMLRSFAYARGFAADAASNAGLANVDDVLRQWEASARAAFLDGYRGVLAGGAANLIPRDDDAFAAALGAWELDKALYEIAYEARNRPDWLWLPLASVAPDVAAQLSEEAGGAPA